MEGQLLAHCGTEKINREQLGLIVPPEGTDTYQPLAHHHIVEAPSENASREPHDDAAPRREQERATRQRERESSAVEQPREDVAAEVVGSERMRLTGTLQPLGGIHRQRIVRDDDRREDRGEHDQDQHDQRDDGAHAQTNSLRQRDQPQEPHPPAFYAQAFTEAGAGKGTEFDYWRDLSFGKLDLTGSKVFGWFAIPHGEILCRVPA